MRLLRYACPHCGQRHRIALWREQSRCLACAKGMALVPGMLSSRVFQIVFVAGALAMGLALGRLRWSMGKLPYDTDQFVLDMACFWLYAWVSRIIYFQFQTVEISL